MRTHRVGVDFSPRERAELQARAAAAALPLRRFLREVALRGAPAPALAGDLYKIWFESATLQSNLNQSVAAINHLRASGKLNLSTAELAVGEISLELSKIYDLVRALRAELASIGARR